MNNGMHKGKGIVNNLLTKPEDSPWQGTFIIETPPDKNKNIWWTARCVDPDYVNLFSAAPEMLEVLVEIKNRYATLMTEKMVSKIEKAIKKAGNGS